MRNPIKRHIGNYRKTIDDVRALMLVTCKCINIVLNALRGPPPRELSVIK